MSRKKLKQTKNSLCLAIQNIVSGFVCRAFNKISYDTEIISLGNANRNDRITGCFDAGGEAD